MKLSDYRQLLSMAVAKNKKSIVAIKVEATAVDQIGSLLAELPERPSAEFSLREAVNELQEPLRAALAKGYSHEELAKILNDNDIKIRVSTLKHYLATAQSASRQTSKTRRTRKAS
jgi:hypothetical protein